MKISDLLKQEQEKLGKDLISKMELVEDGIKFKDLITQATENNVFKPEEYLFSDDEEYLYELLTKSMGLGHLWIEYIKEHKDFTPLDINLIILQYMINMFGLDIVENSQGEEK